jgi:hypothetical protein
MQEKSVKSLSEEENKARNKLIDEWRDILIKTKNSDVIAVPCAAEWLVLIIMACAETEQEAHVILNATVETSHLYINSHWRKSEEYKREQEMRA